MPRLKHWIIAFIVLIGVLAPALTAQAVVSSVGEFDATWARTDLPVADGDVSRTWMWGPAPFTEPLVEPYNGVPENSRAVQYFDKSRMEINDPNGDPNSPWFVTNGLLVVEMTSGEMHTGFDDREYLGPAEVKVAGDADDIWGPTYASIGENIAEGYTYDDGQLITGVIDFLGYDPVMSENMHDALAVYGVTAGPYSPQTGKHTASVFWDFMTSNALVYENGGLVNAPLFQDPYYATGLPIDQAWWAQVKVAGTSKWVLVQCFERRCLTYTPDNPAGWQVEAGNVGLHYYEWRYGGDPVGPPMTENDYIDAVYDIDDEFLASVEYLEILWEDFDPHNATWVQQATSELAYWRVLAEEMDKLNPPASLAAVHQMMLDAYDYIVDASYFYENGIVENDEAQLVAGDDSFTIGWNLLSDAFLLLVPVQEQLTEQEYLELVWAVDDAYLESLEYVYLLMQDTETEYSEWEQMIFAELDFWQDLALFMDQVAPPDGYGDTHASFLEAYGLIWEAADDMRDGITLLDVELVDEALTKLDAADVILEEIFSTLPEA